jgi:hypothetical protein
MSSTEKVRPAIASVCQVRRVTRTCPTRKRLRAQLVDKCLEVPTAADRSAAALAEAQHRGIAADQKSYL